VPGDLKNDTARAMEALAASGSPVAAVIVARLQGTLEIPQDVPASTERDLAAFGDEMRRLTVVVGSADDDVDTSPCGEAARGAAAELRGLAAVLGPEHGGPVLTLRDQAFFRVARAIERWAAMEEKPGGVVPARRASKAGRDLATGMVEGRSPLEDAARRFWPGAKSRPGDSYANLGQDLLGQGFKRGTSISNLRRLVRRLRLQG